MQITEHIAIHAAQHPVPQVQRAGFPLDDPYLDHCWAPVLGPSGTLLLRRLPWLWKQAAPVEMALVDLSRSLGLGAGTGRNSPACRTIDRLVGFRLASWGGPGDLDVYVAVAPLSARQLDRLPAGTRRHHDPLLGRHLDELAATAVRSTPVEPSPATRALLQRLDRLQQRSTSMGLSR